MCASLLTFDLNFRTFKTHDFMTGVPAIPGRDISIEVL